MKINKIITIALSAVLVVTNIFVFSNIHNTYALTGNLTEVGEFVQGTSDSTFTATLPLATYQIELEGGQGGPGNARYYEGQNVYSAPSYGGRTIGDVQLEAGDTVSFAFFAGGERGTGWSSGFGGAGGTAVLAKIKGYYPVLGAGAGGGGSAYKGTASKGQDTHSIIYEDASLMFGSGGGGGAENNNSAPAKPGTGGGSTYWFAMSPGASGQNYYNPYIVKNIQSLYNGTAPRYKITLKSIDGNEYEKSYPGLGTITRVGQFVENNTTAKQYEATLDKGLYKIQMWNTNSKLVEGTIILNKGDKLVFDQVPKSYGVPKSIIVSKDGMQLMGIGGIGTTTFLDDGAGNISKQGSGIDTFFGYNGGASYINTFAMTDVFSKTETSADLKYRITLLSIPAPDLGDIKKIVNEALDESGVSVKKINVIKGKQFKINVPGYDTINTVQKGSVKVINEVKGDKYVTLEGVLNTAGEQAIIVQNKTFLFNVIEEPDSSNVTVIFN